eukprot:gnl/Hemi2/7775_TR2684_c0_g1_i1.p1 gnl/Hemi2/7775_TR2684_c0_g1~~gnl/Hemi2/7775_TR2684_c0_g1_i1.p1  ORF type:complete len:736 (+),score=213.29 gnl/Hemi2/7775_TR2684_c0_g1_i1:115-2322(+)
MRACRVLQRAATTQPLLSPASSQGKHEELHQILRNSSSAHNNSAASSAKDSQETTRLVKAELDSKSHTLWAKTTPDKDKGPSGTMSPIFLSLLATSDSSTSFTGMLSNTETTSLWALTSSTPASTPGFSLPKPRPKTAPAVRYPKNADNIIAVSAKMLQTIFTTNTKTLPDRPPPPPVAVVPEPPLSLATDSFYFDLDRLNAGEQYKQALAMCEERYQKPEHRKISLFTRMMRFHAKLLQTDDSHILKAVALFDHCEHVAGIVPSREMCMDLLPCILHPAFPSVERDRRVRSFLDKYKSNYHFPGSCFQLIIDCYLREDRIDTALRVLAVARDKDAKSSVPHTTPKALPVGAANQHMGLVIPSQAYKNLITALLQKGRTRAAIQMLMEQFRKRIDAQSMFLQTLRSCALHDDVEGALASWHELITVHKLGTSVVNDFVLTDMLYMVTRTGCLEVGDLAWNALLERCPEPPAHLVAARIDGFVAGGKLEEAFKLLCSLGSNTPRAQAVAAQCALLAERCSETPELVDEAYMLLVALKEKGEVVTVEALNVILAACASLRDLNRVMLTYPELANTFGLAPNVHSFNAILLACSVRGTFEEAQLVHKSMTEAGFSPSAESFAALLSICLREDELELACKLLDEVEEAQLRVPTHVLVLLVRKLAVLNQYEMCRSVLSHMTKLRHYIPPALLAFARNPSAPAALEQQPQDQPRPQQERQQEQLEQQPPEPVQQPEQAEP